jgi:calcium permeable stress-gated cation channel
VFVALLHSLLLFLSKFEGIPTQSHSVRAASGEYFYFIVFNVFIGYTIGNTLFKSLTTVLNNLAQIVGMLARNLPRSATFFLTFVAMKYFSCAPLNYEVTHSPTSNLYMLLKL